MGVSALKNGDERTKKLLIADVILCPLRTFLQSYIGWPES